MSEAATFPRSPAAGKTWHVLGAGSIGGLFALRLVQAGLPVTLLLRDAAAVARWQAAGAQLQVQMPDGSTQACAPAVATATTPAPHLLLVTTKAHDTMTALAPHLAGDGAGQLVLLLQNGMGVAEALRARWPALRLWCGVTTAGAWREHDFRLHCVATGECQAGRHDDAGDAALDAGVAALAAAGLLALEADIRPRLWRKLAVNALINPLTALHGCRNGELAQLPAAQPVLAALAAELEQVLDAVQVTLGQPVLAIARAVIASTAGNYSSMNRDIAAGRRTEIDSINGYVVARAQALGVAVPTHRAVLDAVHALEARSAAR